MSIENYINNYYSLFLYRHEELNRVPQEIVDFIADPQVIEDLGLYEHYAMNDYDNLAYNAEIVEKSEIEKDEGYKKAYKNHDFLFETDNYVVFSW